MFTIMLTSSIVIYGMEFLIAVVVIVAIIYGCVPHVRHITLTRTTLLTDDVDDQ